jgi:RES domain-containing protein
MKTAWRIVKEKHAANAFDGEGARLFGGRWNSQGTRVVYTSSALSLAALELLVHLNPPMPFRYAAISVSFDDAMVHTIPAAELPEDWMDQPPPQSSQAIGDLWVQQAHSAVLELPSVIIPTETNFLLNPAHPDFKNIQFGKPVPFSFDPRLL